jgi:hypothetical protein
MPEPLTEAQKALKNELQRQRHAANPEKRREADRRRYAANAEKRHEATRRWRAANSEKYIEATLRRRAANTEKTREYRRRYHADNPHIKISDYARRIGIDAALIPAVVAARLVVRKAKQIEAAAC